MQGTEELREGSIVTIASRSLGSIEVKIDNIEIEGKNGQDVIDYTYEDEHYWAYMSQIINVVKA